MNLLQVSVVLNEFADKLEKNVLNVLHTSIASDINKLFSTNIISEYVFDLSDLILMDDE